MANNRYRTQGFSLLELVMTLALMAGCLTTVFQLQSGIIEQNASIHRTSQALNLAEQTLEAYRTRGADAVLSSAQVVNYGTDLVTNQWRDPAGYDLRLEVMEKSPVGRLKHITITVIWQDSRSIEQSVALTTMLAGCSEFRPCKLQSHTD